MTEQLGRKKEDCNPRTSEEARSYVAFVRFGVIPEFRGHDTLRKFFTARSAKQRGYRLRKQFRTLMNDVMTNIWDGEWEDADTSQRMRGFGVEVWTMRGGKIAIWEAAFNAALADQDVDINQALR